jgi:ribose transport system permease protein
MNRIWRVFGQQTALVIVLVIFSFFSLTVGSIFLSPGNLENIARQISIDAPVAFGQSIVLIAGGIDISVGSNMAMCAALAIGLQSYGTPVAVLIALLFGTCVGAMNGLLVTRGKIVPFIATLGTMSLVSGILFTYTRQQPLPGHDEGFTFWGNGSIGPVPVPIIITLMLMSLLTLFLRRTRAGRNLYAVGGSKEAAYLAGISVQRFQFLAFTISGFTAGLAGVLLASRLNSATVQLGTDTPLLSISAAIIGGASLLGGRGSTIGAFLGVLALGALTNGMNLLGVQTYYQIAIRASILIGVVAIDAFSGNLTRRRLALAGASRPTAERRADMHSNAPAGH